MPVKILVMIINGKYTYILILLIMIAATVNWAILCPNAPNRLIPTKLKYLLNCLYTIHINKVLTKAPAILYIIDVIAPDAIPAMKHLNKLTVIAYLNP